MTTNLVAAIEQTQQLFLAAWTANAGAVFGYVPDIEWHGQESVGAVDRSKVWVRFSTQNVFEQQASFATDVAQPFQRRYESSGLVFVQLFLPKTVDNAVTKGRSLAQVAKAAFRGKSTAGGVTFNNVRINDGLTPEELFYRINVVAEYEFDELG